MTEPKRPLEKYDHFSLPTVLDLKADLTDILGYARAEAIWNTMTDECSIKSDDFLTVEQLQKIANWCIDTTEAIKSFGF